MCGDRRKVVDENRVLAGEIGVGYGSFREYTRSERASRLSSLLGAEEKRREEKLERNEPA